MKTFLFNLIATATLLFATVSCAKEDDLVINYDLAGPLYDLPMGEEGSVDRRIYNIFQKSGTYVLYDFDKKDLTSKWTTTFNRWYSPANQDSKTIEIDGEEVLVEKYYIHNILDALEEQIFNKFDAEFLKKTMRLKVFIVDSLSSTSSVNNNSNTLDNGQDALIVRNAGIRYDGLTASGKNTFKNAIGTAYIQMYYSELNPAPEAFKAFATPYGYFKIISTPLALPSPNPYPEFITHRNVHNLYTIGFIKPPIVNTAFTPYEYADFADYVDFMTNSTATHIKKVTELYPMIMTRAKVLAVYLKEVMGLNIYEMQHSSSQDDKLEVGYFD